jgi:smad nuclear-interacting protein 1
MLLSASSSRLCLLHGQRFYVYKGEDLLETLHINRQSAYLCGRNTDIADIPLLHPSCSSQHAVVQFRATPDSSTGKINTRPYIMDLESANGTLLNDIPIDAARYYQLKKGDVLRFGASTREYVLLTADATKI